MWPPREIDRETGLFSRGGRLFFVKLQQLARGSFSLLCMVSGHAHAHHTAVRRALAPGLIGSRMSLKAVRLHVGCTHGKVAAAAAFYNKCRLLRAACARSLFFLSFFCAIRGIRFSICMHACELGYVVACRNAECYSLTTRKTLCFVSINFEPNDSALLRDTITWYRYYAYHCVLSDAVSV